MRVTECGWVGLVVAVSKFLDRFSSGAWVISGDRDLDPDVTPVQILPSRSGGDRASRIGDQFVYFRTSGNHIAARCTDIPPDTERVCYLTRFCNPHTSFRQTKHLRRSS